MTTLENVYMSVEKEDGDCYADVIAKEHATEHTKKNAKFYESVEFSYDYVEFWCGAIIFGGFETDEEGLEDVERIYVPYSELANTSVALED